MDPPLFIAFLTILIFTCYSLLSPVHFVRLKNFISLFFVHFLLPVLPKISPFSFGDEPIYYGQVAQATCLVTEGDYPLEVTWSFQGSHLSTQTGISTTKVGKRTSLLLIDPTQSGHTGNYTCTAKNKAGITNITATLNIYGKK